MEQQYQLIVRKNGELVEWRPPTDPKNAILQLCWWVMNNGNDLDGRLADIEPV